MFLKNIVKFFLLFIGLCIFSSSFVYAETPPKWVYRFDTRSPQTILYTGFKTWGTNYNIHEHISGISCYVKAKEKASSGFIATTSVENIAIDRAKFVLKGSRRGIKVYVYKIRADSGFYDMNKTLTSYNSKLSLAYGRYLEKFGKDLEWISENDVRPNMIQGWRAYTITDIENGNTPPFINNNNYVDGDTRGNSDPYPSAGQTVNFAGYEAYTTEDGKSACFSPTAMCPLDPDGRAKRDVADDVCENPEKIIKEKLPPKPFSESSNCKTISLLFYAHLSCKTQHIYFYANLGGIGAGLAPVWGTLYFADSFDQYLNKSCSVSTGSIGPYTRISMDCGDGLTAHFDGGTFLPSVTAFAGTGYFSIL